MAWAGSDERRRAPVRRRPHDLQQDTNVGIGGRRLVDVTRLWTRDATVRAASFMFSCLLHRARPRSLPGLSLGVGPWISFEIASRLARARGARTRHRTEAARTLAEDGPHRPTTMVVEAACIGSHSAGFGGRRAGTRQRRGGRRAGARTRRRATRPRGRDPPHSANRTRRDPYKKR